MYLSIQGCRLSHTPSSSPRVLVLLALNKKDSFLQLSLFVTKRELVNVDFMVKDSRRFADSGGGVMPSSITTPRPIRSRGTAAGTPPQGNDARCGFACHSSAK